MSQNAGLPAPQQPGRPVEDSRPPVPPPVASAAPAPPATVSRAGMRASDQDRDAVVGKLQQAFAEGRIDDEEFDGRVRAVLASRTFGELEQWTADLPQVSVSQPSSTLPVKAGKPARLSLAYKTRLRRGGRWRVPAKFNAVAYKGGSVIDLRVAELVEGHTTIRAIAYKCTVTVLVAPGMRFELSGIGVDEAEDGGLGAPAAGAPVVRIKGIAYKGRVEVRTLPDQPQQMQPQQLEQ
ncbi:MAG TPA: DUF1707 domain-containing protein [Actinocrinis sp.]|jgi:hypothetical protein